MTALSPADRELVAAIEERVDGDPADGPWHADDTPQSWRLHRGDRQIAKASKSHPHQQPYWPTPEQSQFIVSALNAAESREGQE